MILSEISLLFCKKLMVLYADYNKNVCYLYIFFIERQKLVPDTV